MPLGSTPEEISLRHLPDVSDSSFSFQIPGAAQEYNLLAEDDLDFFSGANVSGGAIPPSPPTNTAPLTVQELTPRPAFETRTIKRSRRKLSPEAGHSDNDNQKEEEETRTTTRLQQPERSKVRTNLMSNLRPITTSLTHPPPADAPPSAGRVTSPKQDIYTRTSDLLVPLSPVDQEPTGMGDNKRPKGIRRTSLEKKLPPSRAERRQQKKAVSRNKQIVIEGGVTKSRPTSKTNEGRSPARISNSVERPSAVFPSYARPTLADDLNGDDSVIDLSMGPSGGVAERLVQYGQQLTNNSFGIYTSSPYLPKDKPIGISNSPATAPAATEVKIITPTEAPLASADDSDSDKPLTVSQLSPRKCPPSTGSPPTPPAKCAESPLRTSSKRPASAAGYSEDPPRKKGKTDGTPSAVGTDGGPSMNLAPTRTRARSKQPTTSRAAASNSSRSKPMSEETSKRQTRGSVSVNVNRMADSKATTSTLLRRSKATQNEGNPMTKYAATSTASSSRSTRVLRNSRPRDEDTRVPASSLLSSSSSSKGKGKAALTASSSTSNSRRQISERAVLPPWDAATKPVPLQSFPESRLLARKGDEKEGNADAESQSSSTKSHSHSRSASQSSSHLSHSSQSQSSQYTTTTAQTERDAVKRAHLVPIPDFRAMHAAQEAKLAQLKENVRPTVPHAPRLVTDLRVKERQRFDEMVREREAEQERVREEQKRLREEEEERELRELRKRAVPRAHEVPEWYKEAPRKKGSKFDSVGR